MKDEQLTGLTARFTLDKVDDVEATVTLTASMRFWKEAANSLAAGKDGYGAWQVRAAINAVIRQAEQTFYERITPERK